MIDFKRSPVLTPPDPRPRQETTTVIPFVRHAYLVDDDDIIGLEVVAVVYNLVDETSRYLARCLRGVGTLSEFAAGDVCFSEGDAIRIRLLRQKHAKRTEEIYAEQRRQCDEAIEMVKKL